MWVFRSLFFTNFSKAFDRVKHEILINKLKLLRICDQMLSSKISYWQQVRVLGFISKEIKILTSVPQGSHLIPFYLTCLLTIFASFFIIVITCIPPMISKCSLKFKLLIVVCFNSLICAGIFHSPY